MIDMIYKNFETIKKDNDKVIIAFWAEWCQPCKFFSPIFEASSRKHSDILHVKVDVDNNSELSQIFNIVSLPSIVALEKGKIVKFDVGARGPVELELFIKQSFGAE